MAFKGAYAFIILILFCGLFGLVFRDSLSQSAAGQAGQAITSAVFFSSLKVEERHMVLRGTVEDDRYLLEPFFFRHINQKCPRFLLIDPATNSGLGDRFFRLALLLTFSLELKLIPAYDPRGLLVESVEGNHGTYPWAEEFFNWGDGMMKLEDVERNYKLVRMPFHIEKDDFLDSISLRRADTPKCNVLYELAHANTPIELMVLKNQPHLYERIESIVQGNFITAHRQSSLPALTFRSIHDYNVVIHIRTGDITLPSDPAFLTNVRAQLERLLEGQPVHCYFIAEDPEAGEGEPPRGFEYLKDLFEGARVTFLNRLNVKASLYHMMNADLLIMTGSGFPYIAAVASWKPVVMHGPNKIGQFPMYDNMNWVALDAQGLIYYPPTMEEVRAKILVKRHQHGGHTLA